MMMIAQATPCQQGQTRGDIITQDNVAALRTDLVSALLGLAAVEVGLLRRVHDVLVTYFTRSTDTGGDQSLCMCVTFSLRTLCVAYRSCCGPRERDWCLVYHLR